MHKHSCSALHYSCMNVAVLRGYEATTFKMFRDYLFIFSHDAIEINSPNNHASNKPWQI